MSQEFTFSDPGEGLQEAEILEVHVSDGDTVADGDVVLTVETDKASTEVPAPFDGTIDQVAVAEGDTVEVGDVLLTYSEDGEDAGASTDQNESTQDAPASGSGEDKSPSKKQDRTKSKDDRQNDQQQDEDANGGKQEPGQSGRDQSARPKDGDKQAPVPAAPSTRRLAREKGVDLHSIEASGKHGRVSAEDVEAAAEGKQAQSGKQDQQQTSLLTPGQVPPDLPDFSQWGAIERQPLRSIRRATARNMARSWSQIPHVYHQAIADVTELERFRRAHEVAHGKLTVTVLVMKALVAVLKQFPRFNASLDVKNQEIVYKHYFHLGLAVATERGLLVPVVRDVDRKSVTELAAETAELAQKTRNGELSRADMSGGSLTLTNPGPMGGSSLTPLINHPQVAILGMAQARLEPVASGDLDNFRVTARLRMPLVLGFDHRVNDGADAARFVTALIDTLANPESLLLAV